MRVRRSCTTPAHTNRVAPRDPLRPATVPIAPCLLRNIRTRTARLVLQHRHRASALAPPPRRPRPRAGHRYASRAAGLVAARCRVADRRPRARTRHRPRNTRDRTRPPGAQRAAARRARHHHPAALHRLRRRVQTARRAPVPRPAPVPVVQAGTDDLAGVSTASEVSRAPRAGFTPRALPRRAARAHAGRPGAAWSALLAGSGGCVRATGCT